MVSSGRSALLVRGGIETSPWGTADVWFSADGVVVRTLNGQLIGVNEPKRSWRLYGKTPKSPLDSWPSASVELMQFVDVQPHDRFSLNVAFKRARLDGPPPSALGAIAPAVSNRKDLTWFQDSLLVAKRDAGRRGTPSANGLFAVDLALAGSPVVFGYRCLDTDWCLSWESVDRNAPLRGKSSAQRHSLSFR